MSEVNEQITEVNEIDNDENINSEEDKPSDEEIFDAIKLFGESLWDVFKTKKTSPLALYWRLLERVNPSEPLQIVKILLGFRKFCSEHETLIFEDRLDDLPRGALIRFGDSDRIAIPIQNFIYKSDSDTKSIIQKHLLTICAMIDPDEDKLAALQDKMKILGIDTSTKEGQFIEKILMKTKDSMQNVDASNPMSAMMGLAKSGVLTDMLNEFKGGGMNAKKLLGTMHGALGQIMNSGMMDMDPNELDNDEDDEDEDDEDEDEDEDENNKEE